MGITFVEVEVASIAEPDRSEALQFLVDSGATYSVVPADVLARLGIRPFTEERLILANGDSIVRPRGGAIFKYQGRIGVSDVLFGEPGDENLLGALTLESMGLVLDPLKRELRNLRLMLA